MIVYNLRIGDTKSVNIENYCTIDWQFITGKCTSANIHMADGSTIIIREPLVVDRLWEYFSGANPGSYKPEFEKKK